MAVDGHFHFVEGLPFSFSVENPRMVAPALCAATVFSTAAEGLTLDFLFLAEATPISIKPPIARVTK